MIWPLDPTCEKLTTKNSQLTTISPRMCAFTLNILAGEQILELFFEFTDIFEIAVHTGEADVGDGVDVLETVHDQFADRGSGALAAFGVDDERFDGVDDLL